MVALPVLLPQPSAAIAVDDLVSELDGLLLQGGSDVCPRTYGEEPLKPQWNGDAIRDHYEIELIRACLKQDKPILGICRGAQLLNVALGGTLYQDIGTQIEGAQVHRDWEVYDGLHQNVVFADDSYLKHLYGGSDGGRINSIHHQAIKDVAVGLRVEATTPEDGVIEAVRLDASESSEAHYQGRYALAVQWHPEFIGPEQADLLDPGPLMNDFLESIRTRNRS